MDRTCRSWIPGATAATRADFSEADDPPAKGEDGVSLDDHRYGSDADPRLCGSVERCVPEAEDPDVGRDEPVAVAARSVPRA
jgi:hypothetical protein